MAKAESDYTADNFLQWFVKEQLEGLFSVLARAICCAWRNSWRERKTAGSLSARKNDQFEKRTYQTDSMCRRNRHLAFAEPCVVSVALPFGPFRDSAEFVAECVHLKELAVEFGGTRYKKGFEPGLLTEKRGFRTARWNLLLLAAPSQVPDSQAAPLQVDREIDALCEALITSEGRLDP